MPKKFKVKYSWVSMSRAGDNLFICFGCKQDTRTKIDNNGNINFIIEDGCVVAHVCDDCMIEVNRISSNFKTAWIKFFNQKCKEE